MDTQLWFIDQTLVQKDDRKYSSPSSSQDYKLVPWLTWDEWDSVRECLFSSSPPKRIAALGRIATWRSRGCLPVVLDVTSAIVEIQLKDPSSYSEDKMPSDAIHSEQILAMLYCMAVLRLVNCVVEKTRKRNEISIAEAADAIGIPRVLIDVRHEGSHRSLPALPVVRDSSEKALAWLKSYYWEPQKKEIPFLKEGVVAIRKDINSKIIELAALLKERRSSRAKRSRKQATRTLKYILRLYSSFCSEVVTSLLGLLLKAANSTTLSERHGDSEPVQKMHPLLDDWNLVVRKFAIKEPYLLVDLLKAILERIETQEAQKYEIGTEFPSTLKCRMEADQTELLSCIFSWLIEYFVGRKLHLSKDSASKSVSETKISIPNIIWKDLLHKCLLVSSYGEVKLVESALHIAQLIGDNSLIENVGKLKLICSSNLDIMEDTSNLEFDESISQAAEKLEQLVKICLAKSKAPKTTKFNTINANRWVLAKSWSPCPIGMLPRVLGTSGGLPAINLSSANEKLEESAKVETVSGVNQCSKIIDADSSSRTTSGKREAISDVKDDVIAKKMRETVQSFESDGKDGHLMVNGVWKNVGQDELCLIQSCVRILV